MDLATDNATSKKKTNHTCHFNIDCSVHLATVNFSLSLCSILSVLVLYAQTVDHSVFVICMSLIIITVTLKTTVQTQTRQGL